MADAQTDPGTVDATVIATTDAARQAAYRRLAACVLGLDVPTLAAELRSTRRDSERLPLAA